MIYISIFSGYVARESKKTISKSAFEQIKKTCYNNEITGLQLYADGNFFNILEGEEDRVRALIDAYVQHPELSGVNILHETQSEYRSFQSFKMGYSKKDGPPVLENGFILNQDSLRRALPETVKPMIRTLAVSFAQVQNIK